MDVLHISLITYESTADGDICLIHYYSLGCSVCFHPLGDLKNFFSIEIKMTNFMYVHNNAPPSKNRLANRVPSFIQTMGCLLKHFQCVTVDRRNS